MAHTTQGKTWFLCNVVICAVTADVFTFSKLLRYINKASLLSAAFPILANSALQHDSHGTRPSRYLFPTRRGLDHNGSSPLSLKIQPVLHCINIWCRPSIHLQELCSGGGPSSRRLHPGWGKVKYRGGPRRWQQACFIGQCLSSDKHSQRATRR